MSDVLNKYFPKSDFAILSGPNFSFEVTKGLPTASVISSQNSKFTKYISKIIAQENLEPILTLILLGPR